MTATQIAVHSITASKPSAMRKSYSLGERTSRKRLGSSNGVVVLVGHKIRVQVDKGHLVLEDGLIGDPRASRFPRIYHGLRRVVVIGTDGFVSFPAIRWMSDQDIAFVMLERDGRTLFSIGPTALSDTRLRRAQACALHSPVAVEIVRHVLRLKLTGQENVLRRRLRKTTEANLLEGYTTRLADISTIDSLRQIEAKAASIYWNGWQDIVVQFPKGELLSVPEHWRIFDSRRSPLTQNARKAVNPINAILNYLYTILESETRLAISALGLDPGFGLLHVDLATRDSLVYDLMEPIRSSIDDYVLRWIAQTPLKRSYFFEERDGTCRLMAPLATQLSETAITWSQEVAPIVEWFAQTLCSAMLDRKKVRGPGSRLTQQRRREAKGATAPIIDLPKHQSLCRTCGKAVSVDGQYCSECSVDASSVAIPLANAASRTNEALKKRADKMLKQREAQRNWSSAAMPTWLTADVYSSRIQPLLLKVGRSRLVSALDVSPYYARSIATGKIIPHKRHWVNLAELVGVKPEMGDFK